MTAMVVDLVERRDARTAKKVYARQEAWKFHKRFENDADFRRSVVSERLAMLFIRYDHLIARLREPLMEMIELAAIMGDDPNDYIGAVGMALKDMTHKREFAERVAARRAALVAEYRGT